MPYRTVCAATSAGGGAGAPLGPGATYDAPAGGGSAAGCSGGAGGGWGLPGAAGSGSSVGAVGQPGFAIDNQGSGIVFIAVKGDLRGPWNGNVLWEDRRRT